jgi:hypothetical protein
MKPIEFNNMKKVLLILILLKCISSNATSYTFDFLAWNLPHDTSIAVTTGDTINFIYAYNQQANLLININLNRFDTVTVNTGDTILKHVVTANDTLISIFIWTQSISYGANYHINNIQAVSEITSDQDVIFKQNENSISVKNTSYNDIRIYDIQGNLLMQQALIKNNDNVISIQKYALGVYVVVLRDEKKTLTKKLRF